MWDCNRVRMMLHAWLLSLITEYISYSLTSLYQCHAMYAKIIINVVSIVCIHSKCLKEKNSMDSSLSSSADSFLSATKL